MDRNDLDRAIERLISQLQQAGVRFSALLYGSAASNEWLPERSDVNLMLVIDDDVSPAGLQRLTPAVKGWHEAGFTPPLIIGADEWQRAADVFPIEITDMRTAYRVLAGTDPLQSLVVAPDDLRRALESELRGKLMRLRQAYVRFSDSPAILGGFASSSVPALLVMIRAIAVLRGLPPERGAAALVHSFGAILGTDASAVIEIAQHRREEGWACAPETYVRYLETVCRAVEIVDQHQHGES